MDKNDKFTGEKISIFHHMSSHYFHYFHYSFRNTSVMFTSSVARTDANGHFVCLNACKFSVSEKNYQVWTFIFIYYYKENEEHFSVQISFI